MRSVLITSFLAGIIAGTALALSGCGDYELDYSDAGIEQTEPDYAAESDIGELEQALTVLPNGYGVMKGTPTIPSSVQARCWTDASQPTWPGGKCFVPFMRTVNVVENTSTCGGPYATDLRAGLLDASTYLRAKLAEYGWTVFRNNPVPDRQHPAVVIQLGCGSPFSGSNSNSVGGTAFIEGGCTTRSAGQLCQFAQTNSRLYTSRFEAIPAMSTWTSTQRQKFAFDILAHEGGHGIGLGHELCGQNPLADLMGNTACQNANDPGSIYKGVFRTVELNWLEAYRP
jgi:hypothetical protein